ncbi:MAG: 30S ribosomal protein S1 [Candidatus Levybacteria bacterium]|nr:30S ribosomal protein S1 [Candidatus Levybacteria bacterium]
MRKFAKINNQQSTTNSPDLGSKGGHATTMAELMAKKSPLIRSFKKGEIVTGLITKLSASEILVDIGAKTEAVVLEKDKNILHSLLSALKVGDKVDVSVLNPESDQGNPVVSLRRFMDEKVWVALEKLKNDETVMHVNVTDVTKGGFLVTTEDGVSGFLPNSQTILNDNPQSFVGKKIKTQVLELNRPLHKIIFSQKAALGEEDFSRSTSQVRTGEIVDVLVSSTTPFGVFVSVKNMEGFIHLSELSWEKLETAQDYFKMGEKVSAQVLGIDKDAKRVNLSIKRMTKDPFEEIASRFGPDKKVSGIIKQIGSIGMVIDLGEGIEGLIKKEKVPPSSTYSTGDQIEAMVSEVDVRRHRVILTPVLKEKPIGYR